LDELISLEKSLKEAMQPEGIAREVNKHILLSYLMHALTILSLAE
jgi:hypothetical protein